VLAHWDEVEGRSRELGHLGGTWTNLGRAAGTVAAGVTRIQLPPGMWSTPAHVHGRNEEIFYVLAGSGLSWQDGETYEVRAGDCLVHHVAGKAHTLLAGDDGLDVLAFGTRHWDEAPTLTRARSVWLGEGWVVLAGDEDHPWEREVAAGPPELPAAPSARPREIVNVADVEVDRDDVPAAYESAWRDLGRAVGSERTGMAHVRVEPGRLNVQHHCHSAEEEIFVVLEGEGTLELVPAPRIAEQGEQRIPVRAGHVVARPPGTRIGHAFRGGDAGLTLLAYGTRDPNDIAYYPRSRKLNFRGVGVIVRADAIDYWDGVEE
jgi:uncharacterized cupin superfamily protein